MTERNLGVSIHVDKSIVMYHTVLCIDTHKKPIAVRITTNPLDHPYYAQVVMHKTRSHSSAVQVARYVRRKFDIEEPVQTHRTPRSVEAMIGYACTRTAQYPPTEATPGWGVFQHIAISPIQTLLDEVKGGHSTSRTRYVVYEVRSPLHRPLRGITHKFDAVVRRYNEAPPDRFWPQPVDVVFVGGYPTQEEAMRQVKPEDMVSELLWTRKPSVDYMRKILRIEGDDIVWAFDGSTAIREYDRRMVCVGPQVYTEFQVRQVLLNGEWPPSLNSNAGRRLYANM